MFAAIIALAAMLQAVPHCLPGMLDGKFLILIPVTVCIAIFERETAGIFFGLFAGVMWDINSATGGSFNAITLTFVGFACGALINHLMRNNLVTACLLCAVALLVRGFAHWFYVYIIHSIDGAVEALFTDYLLSFVCTMALLPFIYSLIRNIRKALK